MGYTQGVDEMTREQLVNQMVVCEGGIITVTMPMNIRQGDSPSFSFPGNEEAAIAVKRALYSFVTTLYDDLFGRMEIAMEMVPMDPKYRIRPGCMHFDLHGSFSNSESWVRNMCNFSRKPADRCADIDTFLGHSLIFNHHGESGESRRRESSD